MSKDNIKKKNNKNKDDKKYNSENEIIIGVTTKQKDKVRAEKKTARTNKKCHKSEDKINLNKTKYKKSKVKNKNNGQAKNKKQTRVKQKAKEIKKINSKKIILSVISVFFIIIIGGIYFLTTPMFNVASIEIYGYNKNSPDTYISLSAININQTNIFAFTKSGIERNLKENAYVEKIDIKRALPNVLKIYVTERKIGYQIEYLNSKIYIDEQGYILEINDEEYDVPIIEGLTTIQNNIQVGKRLNNEDLQKMDSVLKISNYLKYNNTSGSTLSKINIDNMGQYTLEFEKGDKIAYIGNSSRLTEKMTVVTKILESEKGKKGKIYADEEALKRNRMYFREEK